MKEARLQFLEALFDDKDLVAWGDTPKTCNKPLDPIPGFLITQDEQFCINPLREWRNTENVTKIQSLLFEVDDKDLTPDQQKDLFFKSGLPFTTMVSSGGKSVHVIVRFTEPLEDKMREPWWFAISKVLKTYGLKCDPAARLVVQISRMPLSIRKKTGELQQLITIQDRVSQEMMREWLDSHNMKVVPPVEREPIKYTIGANDAVDNMKKFDIARKFTEKKHGTYSTYMPTGAHMWLFYFAINCYKVDLSLDASMGLARVEWGSTYTGSSGTGKMEEVINKGWKYAYNRNIEKIELR